MEWLQRANALAYFAKWQWRWKKFYHIDLQVDEEDDFIEYPPGEHKIFTTVIKKHFLFYGRNLNYVAVI